MRSTPADDVGPFQLPVEDLDRILERTEDLWRDLHEARILIPGGSGFFGRWLLGSIAWANHRLDARVRAVTMSRDPAAFLARFPEAGHNGLSMHAGDVRYTPFPAGVFTHILQLATETGNPPPEEQLRIVEGTLWGTRRLLEFAAHRCGKPVFLYASSGAVYGPQPAELTTVDEGFTGAPPPHDPRALFGNAKRMSEQYGTLFHQQYGLETRIARAFSFIGPHLSPETYAVGNFIRDAVAGAPIRVNGDGSPVRSYLYAADLTVWLWRILLKGQSNRPYNVGSDQPVTMAGLADLVRREVAPETPVHILGQADPHPGRARYVPNIDRARAELGLEVFTPLDEAIRKSARWWRHHGCAAPVPHPTESKPKTFVVDIDGVIAALVPNNHYPNATPLTESIRAINRLYDAGHRILLFTARGSATGLDWKQVTRGQMAAWGVKYHELHFGKPAADVYIDDRMLPLEMLGTLGT